MKAMMKEHVEEKYLNVKSDNLMKNSGDVN